MALSQSVTDSLQEAEQSLRNALSFAARGERSIVAKQIAEMIHSIEMMYHCDTLMDHIEELKEDFKKNG